MKCIAFVAFGGLAALLGGCVTGRAASVPLEIDESEIDQAQVPEAALASLTERAGGQEFTGFEREDRGLYVAYEAEWWDGEVEAEATVLSDGGLLEEERALTAEDFGTLPPAILAQVRALEARGYEVSVGRRTLYLYDLDLRSRDSDVVGGVSEEEVLLRPDGSEATKPAR